MITLQTLVSTFKDAQIVQNVPDAITVENTEDNRVAVDLLDRQTPGMITSFIDLESQRRIILIVQNAAVPA